MTSIDDCKALVAEINAEIDAGLERVRGEPRARKLPGDVELPEGWPTCGHSACRQNWIDTGAHDVCVYETEECER
jgi:hypothetical protein